MWVAFANVKANHYIPSKNISVFVISNDQSFNDTLTNDIVSFKQLSPVYPGKVTIQKHIPPKVPAKGVVSWNDNTKYHFLENKKKIKKIK